jgi:hypothetical protein
MEEKKISLSEYELDYSLVNYKGEKNKLRNLLQKPKNIFVFIRHFN